MACRYGSIVTFVTFDKIWLYQIIQCFMTKVDAIRKVMQANGGSATLSQIYDQAKKHKRDIDASENWKAGIRGVLYREVRNGRNFCKVQDAKYGLI